MRMKWCALLALVLGMFASGLLADAFSFHGRFVNASGKDFERRLPMTIVFQLYAQQTGGSALWGRSLPVQIAEDGMFQVILSDDDGSPLSNAKYSKLAEAFAEISEYAWIGVTPAGYTEITPRQRMGAQPYAVRATVADEIETAQLKMVVADGMVAERLTAGTLTTDSFQQMAGKIELCWKASQGKRYLAADNKILFTHGIQGITRVDGCPFPFSTDVLVLYESGASTFRSLPCTVIYPKLGGFSNGSSSGAHSTYGFGALK